MKGMNFFRWAAAGVFLYATPLVSTAQSALESPGHRVFEGGVGVIRGWTCELVEEVKVTIDDHEVILPVGSERPDTADVCGNDGNNGFGAVVFWQNFGQGVHNAELTVGGELIASHTFRVSGADKSFLRGIKSEKELIKFPSTTEDVRLEWSQAHQNFIIAKAYIPEQKPLPQPAAGAVVHDVVLKKGERAVSYSFRVPSGSASYTQLVRAFNQRAELTTICGDFANGFVGTGIVCIGGSSKSPVTGGASISYNFNLQGGVVADQDIRIRLELTAD